MLLMHISREIDLCQPLDDPLLDLSLRAVAVRLHAHYHREGAPYGDAEAGFREWIYERWPSPLAA